MFFPLRIKLVVGVKDMKQVETKVCKRGGLTKERGSLKYQLFGGVKLRSLGYRRSKLENFSFEENWERKREES